MDKIYDHKKYEEKIYKLWEKSGAFTPKVDNNKKPYTIILPLPNASGKMHTGNVLMIAIEDLLIRWKRMQGFSALWIPGTDHAGIETQVTFERHLKETGKSRFDFDRQTLYKMIWGFVQENKHLIESQIRSMGASVDWTRYKFSLDPDIVDTVLTTFEKLHADGLVYKDDYMVNYCPGCGTTFADLEVVHKERKDPLYYVRYPLVNKGKSEPDYIVVATVRPEPIFVDTHLAVNPKDKKNNWLVGKKVKNPLTGKDMEIIADDFVDPKFGTGIVKMTPAHDKVDLEVAKKHSLPINKALDLNGKVLPEGGKLTGLNVVQARKMAVKILGDKGLLEKVDRNYSHSVAVCYKVGHDIEPTILPNWFVKVATLKKPAHDAVKRGKVRIFPKWQEIKYHRWMESMLDWPVSRQAVWGIRIPVWYNLKQNPKIALSFINKKGKTVSGPVDELTKKYSLAEIEKGLQTLIAPHDAQYRISKKSPGKGYLQETDTFDTWFSSGQWPLVTLGYPASADFKNFYPTDVLETAWEILRLWVSRMIMFGIYLTGKSPFKDVYLHGVVRALDGKKMSKSLGNVINPDDYQTEFGTDALRMGLVIGNANGHDFNFPRDKVTSAKNFANKIWNMGRFMKFMFEKCETKVPFYSPDLTSNLKKEDKIIIKKLNTLVNKTDSSLEKYRFADAADAIYHFMWHELADKYIETMKNRADKDIALSVLRHIYLNCLKLLHPFMPFVTEAIWQELKPLRKKKGLLITSLWPRS
ncbi:MAG: hypothetical protein ACD_52C00111G0001 [uncultured bacterium]|uniref:Valine--tRNA ligase n=1 Tax=Candidatus Woesebacteria bacterium RIFCSPHIGHO2_12_FULL_41_24 TaxID=1802510 RepID=A0A1F8AV27_9BACT|nr:MAG: hypothetical protein ACD_52C00111G0001 [uncultured bacterium]OGM14672.1 MAG: valine--tRNA ligase [Candidatus Woesebacteria bacterium RBG_16_41_13]OGM29686.1 MAG: valine--tRNA ligase [Candidatus Woesebacteria bacterium RIFCSPHIGHO2_01_FULL_42_80]OGM35214.1 MAG: valine--tRNA ligase [Candidatus Woesebacteria bacterium RIFCSPHIGHO2_02_FULL_42_20]OGM55108.1 MAG: valine--tRNA ligase [Candidatus Woesebacteria bacterium RIFCSPHIGHO2_12_FULL_41_24]OGM67680.1 MAG: valine--tRNA ligase [Candidatus